MFRRSARAVLRLRAAALLLVAGGAASLGGCATVDRRLETRDFTSGLYASSRTTSEARAAEGGADRTLDLCMAGTAALAAGDVNGAHRHFTESFTDLEDLTATTGETAAAIVGSESSKRWKGDPHERCMNAYYLGVTSWLRGDPDNAAAAFKAGLLRDADSEKGAAQSDFEALWFLLGMAQREAQHEDRGALAFARARALLPQNAYTDPARTADANVLLVIETGLGPRKAAVGEHGSQVTFVRRQYATASADVTESGRPLGRSATASDVYVQAVTRGRKTLDSVNEAKAALKDAAVIGGAVIASNAGNQRNVNIGAGMILAGLLLQAEADTRYWSTLPGEIHVWTGKLPPGEHVLRVEPQDASGAPVPGTAREIRVTVRDGHVAFAWMRAGPAPAQSRAGR